MSSKRLLPLINLAKRYGVRPSEMLKLDDSYIAYCFDEAAAYIDARVMNGDQPRYEILSQGFGDFYKQIEGGG
ncbi:MAG: hypothetical protein HFE39_09640 [Clostridiales bacterium]|nr:hypothetical protein [Clostridiales bacterium]